jgi:transposase
VQRKLLIPHDAVAYALRNRIERFFNKLKHFRHIATRYDGPAIHFLRLPPSRQCYDLDAINVNSV